MERFLQSSIQQHNPLIKIKEFLDSEKRKENSGDQREYDKMRFIGYVLDIGFETATIITSDPLKKAVGGIPRGSFLIMAPDNFEELPIHFTLLRVMGSAATPLKREVQQTYFELHKRSMPELDRFTQAELQWGALDVNVLGMFYVQPKDPGKIAFSGDVNNVVSPHRYKVFSPTDEILDIIVNGTVREEGRFPLGKLRMTECELPFANQPQPKVDVNVSTLDFRGFRTAMFGKTRLGKSNVVKLIAESIIKTTESDKSVGQLIFDVNGEYANDNPQDGNLSIRKKYESRCQVYALTPRVETPSKPLKLNFYTTPDQGMKIIASELKNHNANYVKSFANAEIPSIESIKQMDLGDKKRAIRKIQMYWAILYKAGFKIDEAMLKTLKLSSGAVKVFNPQFNDESRKKAYENKEPSDPPKTLSELASELLKFSKKLQDKKDKPDFKSSSGNDLFDADDKAMLEFLGPSSGSGPVIIRSFLDFHDPSASDFQTEILKLLDDGMTVILDLGNATDQVRNYFSEYLSRAVFSHQERKFVDNKLAKHFVQIYFEEAHNLFPRDSKDVTGVYSRFAKEGAKFHIGMVYSTQSPTTISRDLLAQTENFFIGHISSQDELNALSKLQIQYSGLEKDILFTRTPGYMRMLTFSHRFVIPVQARKFE